MEAGEVKEVVVEEPKKRPGTEEKQHRTKMALVILLVVLVPTILFAVFPRLDMQVKVWYSEGMLGSVTVDVEIRNTGTVDIAISTINLQLMNSTESIIDQRTYTTIDLAPRTRYDAENMYLDSASLVNETHWSTFKIGLRISFTANGRSYLLDEEYTTTEPEMALTFKEEITHWG